MKRYFKTEADLDEGIVTFYMEFSDDWATRQVEICGDVWRWGDGGHPEYLADQPLSAAELEHLEEIRADDFELVWAEALSRCPLPS